MPGGGGDPQTRTNVGLRGGDLSLPRPGSAALRLRDDGQGGIRGEGNYGFGAGYASNQCSNAGGPVTITQSVSMQVPVSADVQLAARTVAREFATEMAGTTWSFRAFARSSDQSPRRRNRPPRLDWMHDPNPLDFSHEPRS